ncbi:MAG: hypothetical protein CMP23_08745 [Rickettsiales bacterium]|nr:hypothetical protein [Rickettsiales bacterium]|tara:strand:- start:1353 stop:2618 length:1266 start_codon:yes stop_codon:yes gene_type:complete
MCRPLTITVLLLCLLGGCRDDLELSEPEQQSALQRSLQFATSQPHYLRPVNSGGIPAGLPDLKASTCGACHQEIYQEWRISTHARAYLDDPQFIAELNKPREGDSDVRWMCHNCHTPLREQQQQLVTGLHAGKLDRAVYEVNPSFDHELQKEAVTCAACHVRDGVVLGPFGNSDAPHATRKSEELLSPALCTACHQAQAHFEDLALACAFDTGAEFEKSPYAAEGFTCQQCHMPKQQRPLVGGGNPRPTRRHWFGGSMIAKQPVFEEEIAAIRPHYPEGLTLFWKDLPKELIAGSANKLRLVAYNEHAGHSLPTGDPERFILINASIKNAKGEVLSQVSERIGARWQWSPQPRKLSDNRLAPRERRIYQLSFTAPQKGALRLELEASKWRINDANLDYHQLRGKTVPGRVFFRSSQQLKLR